MLLALAIAACAGLAALCSAAEHALADASRARLDDMLDAEQRKRFDRLLAGDHELALSAVLYRAAFETAAVVLLVVHPALGGLPLYAVIGWALALVLAVSEIAPRLLADRAPETALLRLLPAFRVLAAPVMPLAAGLFAAARFTRRRSAGADGDQDEAAEEILSAVTEGEKEGSIGGEQADMIENIIELKDADVAEIMTPRPDMASINVDTPLAEAVQTVLRSGHSRFPVFRGTRDDIVGVLYARDLLATLAAGRAGSESPALATLVRPAYFVPETMRIRDLLRQFQERKTTLAVVVDEYGGTAGIVTVRDLVRAIVGEVRDPDEPQREPVVSIVDDHTLEADARTPVRRLNEDFGADIPESEEYDTVAGYLCAVLGRVPRQGEGHACGDTHVLVLQADPRRIRRVGITLPHSVRASY